MTIPRTSSRLLVASRSAYADLLNDDGGEISTVVSSLAERIEFLKSVNVDMGLALGV